MHTNHSILIIKTRVEGLWANRLCNSSSERLYWLREELCTPCYCIAPNPQWRFPVWESCVDKLVEILLCEGGDVELGARTSKHILVFAFDPLSLTLSLFYIVPCIISYC